jgi:hypothetical protein
MGKSLRNPAWTAFLPGFLLRANCHAQGLRNQGKM